MKVNSENEVTQSCPTLSDPMDCSLPGSSVHRFSRQEYWSGVPLQRYKPEQRTVTFGNVCSCSATQSCLTLYDPMDCGLPGFSVHGICQARILGQIAISYSRVSSGPRDGTCFSYVSCIGRQVLYHYNHLGNPLVILEFYFFFLSKVKYLHKEEVVSRRGMLYL